MSSGLNRDIGLIGLSEKCSMLFVFKIITKYFQYENLFFYLGSMPIYKTGLKEPVETRFAGILRNQKYAGRTHFILRKTPLTLLGNNTSITRKMSFQTM